MKTAAFIDLDGTLLRGESQFSFMMQCWSHGLIARIGSMKVILTYAAYVMEIMHDAGRLRDAGFMLMHGLSNSDLEQVGKKFAETTLMKKLRKDSIPLLAAHKTKDHLLVLVTSACELIACPFACLLGIDHVIATRLKRNNGLFTGQRESPEPYGHGKRTLVERFAIEHGVSLADSYAYSDHHSDLSLLELVGHPRVVHPTRELKKLATARGWEPMSLDENHNGTFGL